jgi:kojibiose phosphorylase
MEAGTADTLSDTWVLEERRFDAANNRHYESLMAIGSGPLQQRAAFEEGFAGDPQDREYLLPMSTDTAAAPPRFISRVGTFMPGVTGPPPTCGEQMINLPALHGLLIFAGHERLDLQRSRVTDYCRRLDLRCGRLSRELTWHTERGTVIGVRFERFISAVRPYVLALRCHLRHISGPPAELRLLATLDADVRTNGHDHFERVTFTGEHAPITVHVQTDGGTDVAAAALVRCTPGVVLNIELERRWAAIGGLHVLDPGAELTICKFAALVSSRHVRYAPLDAVRNLVWQAAAAGFDRLAEESAAIWQQWWAHTDIEIKGDPASQLGLRASLYHLLRCAGQGDPRVSLDPTAATSASYCGRYFWDADVFMLPVFLYTRPAVGRALADFRLNSLPGARRNAHGDGYPGARGPGPRAPDGREHSPDRQQAEHALHVTADVAYALWHAHRANPDDVPFLARVTEALTEAARYWSQRVTHRAAQNEYELLLVTGPDTYTPLVRNNAYTNGLVAATLKFMGSAWQTLQQADPASAAELRVRLALSDPELAHFAEIAGKLRQPYDADRHLLRPADDFDAREPFDFDRWWPDRTAPLAACVARERLHRSQVLSQADVLQLMTLLPQDFTTAQMRAAYDTYAPLTSLDEPASHATHALIAARLSRPDADLRHWDASISLDLMPPVASNGIHAAAAANNWQAAVFGFAGVQNCVQSDVLRIDPRLPPRWSALRFPLVWRGQPLHLTIEHGRVTIDHQGEEALFAEIAGNATELPPGQTRTIDRDRSALTSS